MRRRCFSKGLVIGVLSTLLVVLLAGGAVIGIGGIRQYVTDSESDHKKAGSLMPGSIQVGLTFVLALAYGCCLLTV